MRARVCRCHRHSMTVPVAARLMQAFMDHLACCKECTRNMPKQQKTSLALTKHASSKKSLSARNQHAVNYADVQQRSDYFHKCANPTGQRTSATNPQNRAKYKYVLLCAADKQLEHIRFIAGALPHLYVFHRTERHTDRQTDKQTDKQIDSESQLLSTHELSARGTQDMRPEANKS